MVTLLKTQILTYVLIRVYYWFLVYICAQNLLILVVLLVDFRRLVHYGSTVGPVSGLSACFNANGSQVLALRRRLPPVLYDTHCETAICQFYHPNYYNACTMKTCSFVGYNDEYVMSGSDDFNLYVWKVPKNNCE